MFIHKIYTGNHHKQILLGILLFFISGIALADDDQLKENIKELQSGIKDVITANMTFAQELSASGQEVYILNYKVDMISPKGKSNQMVYEFNLADLDDNLINRQASGSVMFVTLRAKNQQQLFKVTQNGMPKGYSNEFRIYVENIDNARVIMDNLKKAIPVAHNKMKNRLNISEYPDMLTWLKNNIGSVNMGKFIFNQKFKTFSDVAGKVSLESVQTAGGNAKSTLYEFNLSDISPNLIDFEIQGSSLVINLLTVRSMKLIKTFLNGKLQGYTNNLKIYADNIDQARDISNILKMAVNRSGDVVADAMPELPDDPAGIIEGLNEDIGKVELGPMQFTQSMEEGCVSEFTLITSSTKGSKEEKYAFNFSDINPSLVDYKINKNILLVELFTVNGQNLIKVSRDGNTQGYTNTFRLYASNPETARHTVYRLKNLISLCKEKYESPVPKGGLEEKITWLTESIGEVSLGNLIFSQELIREGDDNLKFEITTAGQKGSMHQVFEFNLCDIDPNSVSFFVKGKDLFVRLETNYKQKIIKSYKNGKTQNYIHEIYIRANDIESARNIIETFRSAIETCKK